MSTTTKLRDWERRLYCLMGEMEEANPGPASKLENLTRYAWEESTAEIKRAEAPKIDYPMEREDRP